MNNTFVAILMGSDSDLPVVQAAADVLRRFNIACEMRVTSAHRTPQATQDYVRDCEQRGCAVFICCAGMAAHLAGSVAAQTIKPVIGVPMRTGALQGLDALLSTVQMPAGIPVACVAIGVAGAKNAAFLAAQILSLQDPALGEKLRVEREAEAEKIINKNKDLGKTN